MSEKKRYIKISDGYTTCTDPFKQGIEHLTMLLEEMGTNEKWTFEIVEMTEEEFEELSEFTGW